MNVDANIEKAYEKYASGDHPFFSHDIAGNITCGYGRLDWLGEFEYPLSIDQKTMKVVDQHQ